MTDIRVWFVLLDGAEDSSEASELMLQAYDTCKLLVNNLKWIKGCDLDKQEFSKLDYLVFDNLEGRDFTKLLASKCAILGPLAISVCLMEGKPIPNFLWPIQNVAMYGCEITCSRLPKEIKGSIRHKVQLMGGLYSGDLTDSVTHLICGCTKSEKYSLAAEKGVKLMLPEWVDRLYEISQSTRVSADDSDMLEQYKCPALYKLCICSTGITSSKERNNLKEIITSNGGLMEEKLVISKTDILLCRDPNGTLSEKFKAARKTTHISCITTDWVYDSVKAGYALPREKYRVRASTSTPTKDGENLDPNFSTISNIAGATLQQSRLLTSVNATGLLSDGTPSIVGNKKRKACDDTIDKIDIKKVKNAGSFLDGCSIYVAGFDAIQREKLHKIINLSGATRYNELSERVSHVIIGDVNCTEARQVKLNSEHCSLVSIEWLMDCLNEQRAVDEERYLVQTNQEDPFNGVSPLSKKTLKFHKESSQSGLSDTITPVYVDKVDEPEDDPLTQKYLKVGATEDTLEKLMKGHSEEVNGTLQFQPHKTSTQVSQVTTDISEGSCFNCPPFFKSLTFYLEGLEGDTDVCESTIRLAGGSVVSKDFPCDYAVYPVIYAPGSEPKARERVNNLWFNECFENQSLCEDYQYFFRPIALSSTSCLNGCVITISGYSGNERQFLKCLIEGLGGTSQDQFSRKTVPTKNVLSSTHLVSSEASGKKYEAAMKWNLPVVTKDWLMKCAKSGIKEELTAYLVLEEKEEASKPELSISSNNTQTPKRQIDAIKKHTPGPCSQVTPINKILQDAMKQEVLSSQASPRQYYPWNPRTPATPDTPIGAFIRDNPSPRLRKEMQKYVNTFPDFVPRSRRQSTPLSELKKRLVDKVLRFGESSQLPEPDESQDASQVKEPVVEETAVHKRLKELQEKVLSSGGGSGARRSSGNFVERFSSVSGIAEPPSIEVQSQVYTVGWDYEESRTQPKANQKVFILSGIDLFERERLVKQLVELGAAVLEDADYRRCTHLITNKLGKNEKTLACMAAGKWILHTDYVEKSVEAGRLLDEAEFEFGNPRRRANGDERERAAHYWRREISKRGYGAFHDLRAIVVAEKGEPLAKVIAAGGGVTVNVTPPFDDHVHATHCLMEIRSVKSLGDYAPLAEQGVKCVNTIYINDFLVKMRVEDSEYIVPYFAKYYK